LFAYIFNCLFVFPDDATWKSLLFSDSLVTTSEAGKVDIDIACSTGIYVNDFQLGTQQAKLIKNKIV